MRHLITDAVRERFSSKILLERDGCWLWRGGRLPNGYGMFWLGSRNHPASHIAYEIYRGEVPTGLIVLHECDNPPCVNPSHLRVGTYRDNTQDMIAKDRGRCGRGVPRPTVRGEIHHLAKLTERDVLAIRAAQSDYRGARVALGRQYGVSPDTIRAILARKIWKHI